MTIISIGSILLVGCFFLMIFVIIALIFYQIFYRLLNKNNQTSQLNEKNQNPKQVDQKERYQEDN